MPRAVVNRFSRSHQQSARTPTNEPKERANNPIFNTERFGQHILKNPQISQDIVDKADLKPTDKVLEIGPGTGNLTIPILKVAKDVTAIEMDTRMAAELLKRVQGTPEQKRLHVIIGDFVKAELPYFDVCISNTPYQISSTVVFRLLSQRPLFRVAILMFQQEFARRLVAQPGSPLWSRLSANVQLYAKVDHIRDVGKNNFRPPPKVESSVIRLVPLNPPPPVKFEEFDGLTRILFSRPNKTVRAGFGAKGVMQMLEKNWRVLCSINETPVEECNFNERIYTILENSGYSEQRASKMSVDDFLKLLSSFHENGIHFA
ncbi:rRNA adenine dimethylase [Mycena belliarum]|uniref:rRNA adenine N(6)-methyltransferase n=1 Tax=Mycena belliarum TaxID=1033014 RepID=A0AAD6U471_9AGAR|nr:rRNA adenine dimethylase [Mycena belliae]